MTNWQARAEALQSQLDDLSYRFDELSAALAEAAVPVVANLTTNETAVGQVLRHHAPNLVTRDRIHGAVYALRHDDEIADIRIIDVFVCKLRMKLARHDIKIDTIWGRGYVMPKAAAAKWDALAAVTA